MNQYIKSNVHIGHNIRKLRLVHNITQEQMASRLQLVGCDISRSTFSKIEAGIRHISLHELQAIADILDVDFNTLLNYHKNNN